MLFFAVASIVIFVLLLYFKKKRIIVSNFPVIFFLLAFLSGVYSFKYFSQTDFSSSHSLEANKPVRDIKSANETLTVKGDRNQNDSNIQNSIISTTANDADFSKSSSALFSFSPIENPTASFKKFKYISGDFVVTETGVLKIKPKTIDAEEIAYHAIESANIDSNSITSRTIKNGTIQGEDIDKNTHLTLGKLTMGGSILPDADDVYTLGSETHRFKDLYLGSDSLHIIGEDGEENSLSYNNEEGYLDFSSNVRFAQNLTVDGVIYGSVSGSFAPTGDVNMDNHIITNIGNADTDFDSTGGLTLAGNLNANSGIDILGANLTVGGTNFIVDVNNGNITAGTYNGNTLTTGTGTLTLNTYALTLSGDSSLNQNLLTSSSPTFVTTKLSGLSDGYIPYHASDAIGLTNSVIYTNGTNVGIGTTGPLAGLHVGTGGMPTIVGINDVYIQNDLEVSGGIFGDLTGDITGNASGTSSNVTGTVSISNGGTGQTTAQNARNALLPSQTDNANKFLQTDGNNVAWQNVLWSQLNAPIANLSLSMQSYATTLTYGAATGDSNLFNLIDTAANTGTGVLLNVTTGNSSLLNPFQVSASNGIFPALAVNNTGKVGIGTNDPTSQLTVIGGATFGATYSTEILDDGIVAIEGRLGIGISAPTQALEIAGNVKTSIESWIGPTNTTGIYFKNGNVGIGTTNPTAKLEIGGTSGTDGIKFPDGNTQFYAATGTTYAEGEGRSGDYYCKKKEVSASGQVSDWENINTSEICGFNKRCENGLCIETDFVCGTSDVMDADGNTYNTVLIDQQCWMASNLKVGTMLASGSTMPSNNETIEKWCYDNNESNCTSDGGLYHWDEAMQYSTSESAQGICPTGWHIPTDAEQYALENYLKDEGQTCNAARNGAWDCSTAGTKLKSGGSSGMNFPLAGGRSTDGSFLDRLSYALFWSSSQSGSSAWSRNLNSGSATVDRATYSKAYGFSVRCLKD